MQGLSVVYDQNFYGGGAGVVDGDYSERCLKWRGGTSLGNLSRNILN